MNVGVNPASFGLRDMRRLLFWMVASRPSGAVAEAVAEVAPAASSTPVVASSGAPGGGTTGGTGRMVSGCTHADRSKNRNSSAFSCADSVLPRQPSGNAMSGLEMSVLSPAPPAPRSGGWR